MASTTPFLTAVQGRRSIYTITKELPIPTSRILEIVHEALEHAPSPFNVRSCRCIVLFGDEHDKLWRHAYEITQKDSPQAIPILGPKIEGYAAGAGSVLFFDDTSAYGSLTPRFAALSKQFPEWEEHSSGMHQFIVWTALTAENLGCSLQHYQQGITPYVKELYDVPESWNLKSQLVFGGRAGEVPDPKPKTGLESALKSFGA
ncbi:Nitroreductase [Aaosphaeria arxii CBS 175.79]|uniref:Nitroreductase n=1 Tax=Aaosphaeria arxii CBS 175.79 TaxID=1450172 RepID=A0A6A5Y232_9PLEO|nr:Nitroreductase [Aaosphaeria arxii CBS 175.79]KAF2019097.1 Nitroreductase [Aaosphaeria arxii CBS 175.79]